jgi:phage terminase large subunit
MYQQAPDVRTFDFSNADLYNPRYMELFYDESPFLHLFGSAGSGKSRFEAQKEIALSFDSNRARRNTLIVRKVAITLKNSVYAELKTVIHEWGLQDLFEMTKSPLQIVNKVTGVTFLFIGLDDVEKVKSISGVDRVWIEEATELTTQDELDQLRLRLRGFKKVQITLSYNPINKFHWINTEIHEKHPEGHRIFKSTYRDNVKMLAVDPGYADYVESLKDSNPNYYKVYGLGEWGQNAEGLIYPDYEVVDQMPPPSFYGLDFGHTAPSALIEGRIVDYPGEDKERLYVNERMYKTKLTARALVAELDKLQIKKTLPIVADNARPEIIQEMQEAGYFVTKSKKGVESIKGGINDVLQCNIKILLGSKNLLKEISNYSWANKDGEWLEIPQKGADHLMDAMRYAVTAARYLPKDIPLTPQEEREMMAPPSLRFDAITARQEADPDPERLERELQAHDFHIGIAEMLRRQQEEAENEGGYFSL